MKALEAIDGIAPKVEKVDEIRNETQQLAERQISEIAERANSASPKVKERVLSRFVPNSEGLTSDIVSQDLFRMQNDFYHMFPGGSMEDVRAEYYPNWTDDEMKEFYQVLYGEEME